MSPPGSSSKGRARKSNSTVPAVEKALDVLELLSESPTGLTMNEIVDALGRTMGEIYRVVVYLAERGYLRQNPDSNRYTLTLRLFELSHRYDPTERLIHAALPLLERIAARDKSVMPYERAESRPCACPDLCPKPASCGVRCQNRCPLSCEPNEFGPCYPGIFSGGIFSSAFWRRQPEQERSAIAERLGRIRAGWVRGHPQHDGDRRAEPERADF